MQKVIKNLENRGYNVVYIEDKRDALNTIISHINHDEVVAFGGSKTLDQIGLVDYIVKNDYKVLNRYEEGLTPEEVYEVERQSLLSDVFISSTNAIAKSGELVNIDGKSNRVAAQIFGPRRVFIVAGTNKICDSLDDAIKRAQEYAAPINAKRFEKMFTTGCMSDSVCKKCVGPSTICKTVVIARRPAKDNRTTIFLVNDQLGF